MRSFLFIVILFFLQINHSICQSNPDFVNQLNQRIITFQSKFTDAPSVNHFLIEEILTDKKVIALGEATHGTKEFFDVKSQIIKEMIIKGGIKYIAMETDYFGLLPLNKFLLEDTQLGSVDDSIKSITNVYAIYYTKEILDLFKWIKKYNLGQPFNKKVQLWGIDMQNTIACVNSILSNVPLLNENIYLTKILTEMKDRFKNNKKLDKETVIKFLDAADSLNIFIKKTLKSEDTLMALYSVRLLKQNILIQKESAAFEKVWINLQRERDKFMADNIIWLNNNFCGTNDKIIVWAHNGHIAHAMLEGTYRMGWYLQQYFRTNFYCIGILFHEGYVRLFDVKTRTYKPFYYPPPTRKNDVIETILNNSKDSVFFLNLLDLKDNATFKKYFAKYDHQREIGAKYIDNPNKDYSKRNVLECFDGLLFFRTTNAAESIR